MSYVFYTSTPMRISPAGIAELAAKEGIGLSKYLDSVGVQTIGIGATVSDIKDLKNWGWDKTITLEEAFDLYQKHLQKYADAVNRALKVPLKQHQFDAIVSVCYNIGTGGMAKSTFMRMINNKASPEEIAKAIRLWNKPAEIRKRRAAEAKLFVDGIYPNNGKVSVFAVSSKTHKPIYSKGYTINAFDYIKV